MKNEKGFTLIEMLIVLLVISVLLLIAIPNVTKNNSVIKNKGCEAYLKTVQAQVQAYEMEFKTKPTMTDLKDKQYITETKCPNGNEVIINDEGVAILAPSS